VPFTPSPADPFEHQKARATSPRQEEHHAIRSDLATAALGGLLFGYDTGVISSALLFVRSVFHLSTAGQSLVAGIVLVGAVLGAIVAGTLSDRFGRRRVILVTALVFVIGALLSAAATASGCCWSGGC
jgi:major inositol transporter-like SP family MFS transporter